MSSPNTKVVFQCADALKKMLLREGIEAIRPVRERTARCGGRQRLAIAPTVVRDLSLIYPEAVVASSQLLGWENLRALELRQTISEWTMPPLENHRIVVQLEHTIDIVARCRRDRVRTADLTFQLGTASVTAMSSPTANAESEPI